MLVNKLYVTFLFIVFQHGGASQIFRSDEMLEACPKFRQEVYAPTCPDGQVHINEENCKKTLVEIRLLPEKFHGISDPDETFTFSGSIRANWELFCDNYSQPVDDLNFTPDEEEYWRPLFYHKNTVNNFAMGGDGYTSRFTANYNLTTKKIKFLWQRFGVFSSTCDMNFEFFPFDSQECSLDIIIKANARAVIFKNVGPPKFQTDFMPDGVSWSFIDGNVSISEVDLEGPRSVASFLMRFRRKPDYFLYSLMAPCCLLSSLQLGSFLMIPNMPDRPMFSVTILLALTFLQGEILARVPAKPQRSYLTNYTDLFTIFAWGCTIYSLISLALVETWSSWFSKIVQIWPAVVSKTKKTGLTRARFIDALAFTVALACFLAINLYTAGVAKLADSELRGMPFQHY